MAYNGYLIKINKATELQTDYTIPHKYIKADSYSVSDNSQDLDPNRDSNGLLIRNTLANKILKIEFNTVPMMKDSELDDLLNNIEKRFLNKAEKKVSITAYVPAERKYVTRECYMVDLEISPYWADNEMIQYQPFRIAFIGYGGA